jgi:serpin B
MNAAAAVWVDRSTPLREDYRAILLTCFGASGRALDFQNDAPKAIEQINAWASERTDGKITAIVGDSDLNSQSRFVLTSAVYFHGLWREPFDSTQTRPEPFHPAQGPAVETPFMRQTSAYSHTATNNAHVVELPYRDGPWSLLLVVPKARDGLAEVEAGLGPEWIDSRVAELAPRPVALRMPRLEIRTGRDLSEPLQSLGLKTAFSTQADFTGLSADARKVALAAVRQVALLKLDEEGTEAVAATGAPGSLKSEAEPVEVIADHPFLLLIREKSSGTIGFIARVADPTR